MTTIPIATGYRRASFETLILQFILGFLTLMVLDGGRIAHITGIAVLAFWGGAAIIILRSPVPRPIGTCS